MRILHRLPGGWRALVAAALSAAIGWRAFIANEPVPILDWFDLAVHETGHLVTAFMPDLVMFLAGSVAQVAFPLAMAVYFGYRRNERPAAAFCLAWAGTSMWDVSVYVADAPVQALPLVGGGIHDWAWILGHFDAIDRAADVAGFVEVSGAVLVLTAIVVALWPEARGDPAPVRAAVYPIRRVRPVAVPGDPWTQRPDDAA